MLTTLEWEHNQIEYLSVTEENCRFQGGDIKINNSKNVWKFYVNNMKITDVRKISIQFIIIDRYRLQYK